MIHGIFFGANGRLSADEECEVLEGVASVARVEVLRSGEESVQNE